MGGYITNGATLILVSYLFFFAKLLIFLDCFMFTVTKKKEFNNKIFQHSQSQYYICYYVKMFLYRILRSLTHFFIGTIYTLKDFYSNFLLLEQQCLISSISEVGKEYLKWMHQKNTNGMQSLNAAVIVQCTANIGSVNMNMLIPAGKQNPTI